jgi:hypothetical protein
MFYIYEFFCVGVMYSGEYDACDVTLSVYPHRASLKNMPGRVFLSNSSAGRNDSLVDWSRNLESTTRTKDAPSKTNKFFMQNKGVWIIYGPTFWKQR